MNGFNTNFFTIEDICICRSIECPRYKRCLRGDGYERPEGIYTVSNLAQICNEDNDFEMFIDGKEWSND